MSFLADEVFQHRRAIDVVEENRVSGNFSSAIFLCSHRDRWSRFGRCRLFYRFIHEYVLVVVISHVDNVSLRGKIDLAL